MGQVLWTNKQPTAEELAAQAAAELAAAKAEAQARVLQAVRTVRLKLVTELPGQETIYTDKEAEAARYMKLLLPPQNLDEFPFIKQEIGVTGQSANEIAQIWLNLADIFRQAGSVTEGARKKAVTAIAAAQNTTQIAAAETALASAMAALGLPE